MTTPNPSIPELAAYVEGYADATNNKKLKLAADWLQKLSNHMCGEGFIGCHGGPNCQSDHK